MIISRRRHKLFFGDSEDAIRTANFIAACFADDLNAWRAYPKETENKVMLDASKECQVKLHTWSRANKVQFDPLKESHHIVSRTDPYGDPFKILGVFFDCELNMDGAIDDLVGACK